MLTPLTPLIPTYSPVANPNWETWGDPSPPCFPRGYGGKRGETRKALHHLIFTPLNEDLTYDRN